MTAKNLALHFFLILFSLNAYAQSERIIQYETDIEVRTDRSIIVTEHIEVYANGNIIKRGITRNLPKKRYLGETLVSLDYDILEVKKDGQPEPYNISDSGNDLFMRLGRQEVFLQPGIYTYLIKYKVDNQVGFFDDFDEIYWNAVGQDIVFSVENARCTVKLPEGTNVLQQSAYTGSQGSTGKDVVYNMLPDGRHEYRVTKVLQPREGLTIAIGFEKGIIDKPSFFLRYGALLMILAGVFFLIPYYISTWFRFGQDPTTPASYPMWESPDKLSAASTSYVRKGRYQTKSFTASIIHLAIKGYVKIEEMENDGFFSKKKYYDVVKLKDADKSLPLEERELLNSLFSGGNRVSIEGDYDPTIENAFDNHKASLGAQYDAFIHKGNNIRLLWLPILVTILVGALSIFLLFNSAYSASINMKVLIGFIPTAILGFILYVYLIRKPTMEKLDLRARIKGFKMYLELAEKDRLNLLNPPELTPEHFEKILPFAFALGVEHKWSGKFKDILEKAQYQPSWNNSTNPVLFANHFGRDFTRSVQGASTQPQKTGGGGMGSGGGGFSGGGGGGGGVGGW